MGRTLVIVEGDGTGGSVKALLGREALVYPCQENFSYGPLHDLPVRQLLRLRLRFWRNTVYRSDRVKFRRPKQKLGEELANADNVEIWLGTSTSEQLLLLGLNTWFRQEQIDLSQIGIRQFDLKNGTPLSHVNIGDLPNPAPLTPSHSEWLADRWREITAPSPETLFNAGYDVAESPLMSAAYRDLISLFPDRQSGLGCIEQRLIQAAQPEWIPAVRVIGDAMAVGRPHLGDRILASRLALLGTGSEACNRVAGRYQNLANM